MEIKDYFESYKPRLKNLKRIQLLKEVEKISEEVFANSEDYKNLRECFGTDEVSINKVLRAVNYSNFGDLEEFSDDFYKMYQVCSEKQNINRQITILALENLETGFDNFDKSLINFAAKVAEPYDKQYFKWLKEIRNSKAAQKIIELDKSEPERLKQIISQKNLGSFYTIISLDNKDEFYDTPYAVFFKEERKTILKEFDTLISKIEKMPNLNQDQINYLTYLKQYRKCLAETKKENLETEWTKLDELWMDVRHYIQLVHEMENGYADHLRVKVIPELSLRIIDDEYLKETEEIEKIHKEMINYFTERGTEKAKKGLNALQKSMAGIYYVPLQCAIQLYFRPAGQSVPNRTNIRQQNGIKIFFDAITTSVRAENAKRLFLKSFKNTQISDNIDHIDWIVYHIAAHEFGHAIYDLIGVKDLNPKTRALLEEGRADFTAYTVLDYMFKKMLLTNSQIEKSLFNFAISELRRFPIFDSQTFRGYIISSINAYNTFEKLGYVRIEGDKLFLDITKTKSVLQDLRQQYEEVLDAEDKDDTFQLDKKLAQMEHENAIVKWLVKELKS